MFLFVAVLLCAGVLATLIYRYDLYDKEPWPLLALVLFAGGATGWIAGRIEDAVLIKLGESGESVAMQAAVASLTEEFLKLLVVLAVAFVFRNHFNDPLDGLIYGAFAGLGAAVEESWFYLQLDADAGAALIGTEIIRLLLHIFLGGLAGFGVGLARFRLPHWPMMFCAAMAADLAIHFGWDYCCGIPSQQSNGSEMAQRFWAIGLMLTALMLFGAAVSWGSRWSRQVLAPRSRERLWGWPFSLIFGQREK